MIKIEHIEVFNFEGAIRGLRNPMNSWDKSDSYWLDFEDYDGGEAYTDGMGNAYIIGENDLSLMKKLYKAGTEHRKYLRQIFVSMDITAPLYWWKEMDQYRINVTTNSCSTMHKIAAKEFELDDFSHEHLFGESDKRYANQPIGALQIVIECLNYWRENYLQTKDKEHWWQMIQLLPSSYNQKRTVSMNYENVINIIKQRSNHKLDEWVEFCKILYKLPYLSEIMKGDN